MSGCPTDIFIVKYDVLTMGSIDLSPFSTANWIFILLPYLAIDL